MTVMNYYWLDFLAQPFNLVYLTNFSHGKTGQSMFCFFVKICMKCFVSRWCCGKNIGCSSKNLLPYASVPFLGDALFLWFLHICLFLLFVSENLNLPVFFFARQLAFCPPCTLIIGSKSFDPCSDSELT